MHADRRTERICPFPAAALPTRVQSDHIRRQDESQKYRDRKAGVSPVFILKKRVTITAIKLQDSCSFNGVCPLSQFIGPLLIRVFLFC